MVLKKNYKHINQEFEAELDQICLYNIMKKIEKYVLL